VNNSGDTILHLIETTGPGGAETVLLDIVRNLDRQKFRSIVVVTGRGWLYENLTETKIPTLIVESNRANDISFLFKLIRIIHNNGVSLIHSHLGHMNFYAVLAGLLSGTPVVVTYHGLIDDWDRKNLKNRLRHALIRNCARCVVTVSNYLKRELIRVWKFDDKKIRTIYNGVDFDAFDNASLDHSIRDEFGISKGIPLIGMIGNIRNSKGYDIYIQAAAEVLRKIPNSRFLIIGQGQGKLLDDLKSLAEVLNISNNVIFTGFRSDVAAILSQLDVFVLSSTTEGLSIATIEAMGMRKPVVVTESGGPEEIVEHGFTGFLVPPFDPIVLAENIMKVLSDKASAKAMGERAAHSVRERFAIGRSIDCYVKLYRECLGKHG